MLEKFLAVLGGLLGERGRAVDPNEVFSPRGAPRSFSPVVPGYWNSH